MTFTGTYRTASEQETRSVAAACASHLRRGGVLALFGDLGTGKTQFVKGLCEGFGVAENVASPTFVLLHRYRGRDQHGKELLLYHLDLYRVESGDEILDLGYEEIFFGDGITMVEWADRLGSLLPSRRIDVHLAHGSQENEREIRIDRVVPEVIRETGKP
ncbi:MAG: tRNA (adenosine(37)-N6)-threonylcarbamoyltransferase complex ATPase subunit type 1 TsaE [Ignavibacteriales bacterium]|nr:tRNA (adenosine(37)-N6)-threonylcarbamoyltransferase complex ATPase subunit type 1 TsaE [Ignavibacteriales bacterium]